MNEKQCTCCVMGKDSMNEIEVICNCINTTYEAPIDQSENVNLYHHFKKLYYNGLLLLHVESIYNWSYSILLKNCKYYDLYLCNKNIIQDITLTRCYYSPYCFNL